MHVGFLSHPKADIVFLCSKETKEWVQQQQQETEKKSSQTSKPVHMHTVFIASSCIFFAIED